MIRILHTPSKGKRRCAFDCPACNKSRARWRERNTKAIKSGIYTRAIEAYNRGEMTKDTLEAFRKIVMG